MERVLSNGFNKRPNKLCKVRVHRVTLQPLHDSRDRVDACACTVHRARHMRNIKGGKRKKLTCEAIFVYRLRRPPVRASPLQTRQRESCGRGERTTRVTLHRAPSHEPRDSDYTTDNNPVCCVFNQNFLRQYPKTKRRILVKC